MNQFPRVLQHSFPVIKISTLPVKQLGSYWISLNKVCGSLQLQERTELSREIKNRHFYDLFSKLFLCPLTTSMTLALHWESSCMPCRAKSNSFLYSVSVFWDSWRPDPVTTYMDTNNKALQSKKENKKYLWALVHLTPTCLTVQSLCTAGYMYQSWGIKGTWCDIFNAIMEFGGI